jgi:hypothetical protein
MQDLCPRGKDVFKRAPPFIAQREETRYEQWTTICEPVVCEFSCYTSNTYTNSVYVPPACARRPSVEMHLPIFCLQMFFV